MDEIAVTVVYASENLQKSIELRVPSGSSVMDAVAQSRIASFFPDVDFEAAPKGVYGTRKGNGFVLREGDRVEVYRPLVVDAKEARRRRALLPNQPSEVGECSEGR